MYFLIPTYIGEGFSRAKWRERRTTESFLGGSRHILLATEAKFAESHKQTKMRDLCGSRNPDKVLDVRPAGSITIEREGVPFKTAYFQDRGV